MVKTQKNIQKTGRMEEAADPEEKKYVFQVRKTNCPYYKLHKLNKDKISDTLGPGHGVKSRRF